MQKWEFCIKTVGRGLAPAGIFMLLHENPLAVRQETNGMIVLRTMRIPLGAEFAAGASPRPTLLYFYSCTI